MGNIGNKEIFAQNLSYYIERCGHDQKEIAEVIGVAPSTFNEWVKGKKYPRIDKIEMLANYFGILKSNLIEGKRQKDTDSPLTQDEETWLRIYHRTTPETRALFINMMETFDKLPSDKQQIALSLLRALQAQK